MSTLITGNTYPVKNQLRALGGRWNAREQGWEVPEAQADQARAIVAAAPRPAPRAPRRSYGGYARFSGGGETYRNPRGRCEDAPCCGCCS